jgi:hypothetical protein
MNLRIQTYGKSSTPSVRHFENRSRHDHHAAPDHRALQRDANSGNADGVSVYDVLEKGLNDLMDLCDVVTDKFTGAISEWKRQNPRAGDGKEDQMDE